MPDPVPVTSRLGQLACQSLQLLLLLAALCMGIASVRSVESDIVLPARVLAAAELKYGAGARERLAAWQQLVGSAHGRLEADKLRLVNDFFNTIPFVSDLEHWGREDYWATPTEMLASNGGDCEDFSIAKYFSLVALGVSIDKLRITYVKARDINPVSQAHMVLTYYATPGAMPLVLDNLIPEIKPASQRPDLTPVYSFNGDGLWLAKARGDGKAVKGGSGNISLWRGLIARMGKEFD
ncbi:transglutaminase-like cysteine peptidase [Actimicrobium sp. CCI2.3]|uniref:transglutaminase-like cysteine peptidase n=1 Tax=Actimicrobium sp. CCI2.3 TaxID=3048616 RepID=UPI002AB49AF3|nr:transglutaminase-like cysteine peptidase [Actimicrobium sp. CCI2.3]MDY7573955.1 transglutaminase-like cysteine peptidase [Actimicrobium sp. CCI2.3]MEB0023087.1 transglutaminase-like cysteine peptidase [Actimicrobium sp. CCI2.3]